MNPPISQAAELDVYHCDLDGINLIEASAGTGKTWNICGLYLRLLLERGLETQRILVVTFTNAATAELRERIRARIVETQTYLNNKLAGSDPFVPKLIDELLHRHGLAEADLARRLDLALQTFDEAAIFTIHGFCQRALADTPFAAGLPMAMELIQSDAELRLQVVHDFWRRHIAGDSLPPALAGYLVSQGDHPEKYAGLVKQHLAKPLATRIWPADIDAVDDLDDSTLQALHATAQAAWRAEGGAIVELLLASLDALNANSYHEASVRQGGRDWDAFFQAAAPLAELGDKAGLFNAKIIRKRTKKKFAPPEHPFFDAAERFLELREKFSASLSLARLRLLRSLLREAGDGLRELKRKQRVVGFDDMLFNLYERLANPAYPWLAGSLKARFPAALIDEFQDTDPLQFEIFRAIYGTAETPLFLVGDPKQAIYSFRHADLHTYLRARQQATQEHALDANQRSSAGLLSALNAVFETNKLAFMLPGLDYRPVKFGDKPRKSFVDQSEPRADLQLWQLHDDTTDPPEKRPARRGVVNATAGEIARLINAAADGKIRIDDQPLRPGDIAVLVRSHAQGSDMKRALAGLRVGSVELSQASIFQTVDAEEVERVLRAILEPGRDRLLRAALATELMGCDAADIEAISHDEARLMRRLVQFNDLRTLWLQRGFGVMYRGFLASERVAERMLGRPDGERRLTNFLHLGESLHQAAETHAAPEALLRYLEAQRLDAAADEAAQLRLESDQNLVQIITIHKAKGLEYPIVFCPFLWDGRGAFGSNQGIASEYHDDHGLPVVDLRGDAIDADELAAIKQRIKLEQSAETLRLIYVALTRAVYRCYLVAGCYSTKAFGRLSASESAHSMLNWLAAGAGLSPQDWFAAKLTPADITAAWTALAQNPHIELTRLPVTAGVMVARAAPQPETLTALVAPARIPRGWRVSSYSGLSHGAVSEQAASDHDARVSEPIGPVPAAIEAEDILRFPRGAAAGECIHAVFENLDFSDASSWDAAIAAALLSHPQALPELAENVQMERLTRMLRRLVDDVTQTELCPGLRLATVTLDRRLSELEFNLPAHSVTPNDLNEALKNLGYRGPRLTFNDLSGYLKGFIDLIFEHQGRYFILDWKSNHLGHTAAAYAAEPISEAMAEHAYHLQYLLYTVALDRYLRRRIDDYHYETHFGGVLYLFVRGVRPDWKTPANSAAGVYFHLPDRRVIDTLNTLLESS